MGDILLFTAFVRCKIEPNSYFSCKIDILGGCPLFRKRGDVICVPFYASSIEGGDLQVYYFDV
jgi:hypothetical protein